MISSEQRVLQLENPRPSARTVSSFAPGTEDVCTADKCIVTWGSRRMGEMHYKNQAFSIQHQAQEGRQERAH